MRYFSGLFIIIGLLLFACGKKEQKSEQKKSISNKAIQDSEQEHPGKIIYLKNCGTCHQSDGSGVSGLYPPLRSSNWVNGDKSRLIKVVLNGLSGPIEVNGKSYNNAMPQFSYLDDKEIAVLLTYLRQSFENNASEVLLEEVTAVRAASVP